MGFTTKIEVHVSLWSKMEETLFLGCCRTTRRLRGALISPESYFGAGISTKARGQARRHESSSQIKINRAPLCARRVMTNCPLVIGKMWKPTTAVAGLSLVTDWRAARACHRYLGLRESLPTPHEQLASLSLISLWPNGYSLVHTLEGFFTLPPSYCQAVVWLVCVNTVATCTMAACLALTTLGVPAVQADTLGAAIHNHTYLSGHVLVSVLSIP